MTTVRPAGVVVAPKIVGHPRKIPAPDGAHRAENYVDGIAQSIETPLLILDQRLPIEDVTERRMTEATLAQMANLEPESLQRHQGALAAIKAAEDKDVFLAMLSHELRTPLNSILLWAQLLQSGKKDAALVARGIDAIANSARSQAMLIDDLLDVSRIVSGTLQVTLKPVALGPVIAEALEQIQRQADEKGVVLEVGVDPDVGEIAADADRLRQIVWNLASNAVKFTPAGGRVWISAARVGAEAHIEVRDTGVGIDPSFLPHVFDRFLQADRSATRAYAGLGLGLAIVAHLVERHGGLIRASSPGPGQGATFTVAIPLVTATEQAARSPAVVSQAPQSGSAGDAARPDGIRVLLVDDDPSSRGAAGETPLRRGPRVETAAKAADRRAKSPADDPTPSSAIWPPMNTTVTSWCKHCGRGPRSRVA